MRCPLPRYFTVALAALALATVTTSREGVGQQTPSSPGPGALLQVPVSSIFPGGVTDIAMGVRKGDHALKARLDDIIARKRRPGDNRVGLDHLCGAGWVSRHSWTSIACFTSRRPAARTPPI
jgi:hypothetical protein